MFTVRNRRVAALIAVLGIGPFGSNAHSTALLAAGGIQGTATTRFELTEVDITTLPDFRADRAAVFGISLGLTIEQVKSSLSKRADLILDIDPYSPEKVDSWNLFSKAPNGSKGKSIARFAWRATDTRLERITLFSESSDLFRGGTRDLFTIETRNPNSPAGSFLGTPRAETKKNSYGETRFFDQRWMEVYSSETSFSVSLVLREFPPATAANVPKGLATMMAAAKKGDPAAMLSLGRWHEQKMGEDREAVELYRQAADRQVAEAQFRLGTMYRDGRGVTKSGVEAVEWLERAAKQGLPDAQYALADLLTDGGMPSTSRVVRNWLSSAAEQGHSGAQLQLADSFQEQGGETNLAESYRWRYLGVLSLHSEQLSSAPGGISTMAGARLLELSLDDLKKTETGLSEGVRNDVLRKIAVWQPSNWKAISTGSVAAPSIPSSAVGRALAASVEGKQPVVLIYRPLKSELTEAALTDGLSKAFSQRGVAAKVFLQPDNRSSVAISFFVRGRLWSGDDGVTAFSIRNSVPAIDAIVASLSGPK